MDFESHVRRIKKAKGFSICKCLDPWGEQMLYYGLYHNHIYTEGATTLEQLIKDNPELKNAMQ